uniref:Uncharacterized protein n=3 Tax=Clytia hemisphaerica TaxID=252671 RepID=A0A7M5X497_9CNID
MYLASLKLKYKSVYNGQEVIEKHSDIQIPYKLNGVEPCGRHALDQSEAGGRHALDDSGFQSMIIDNGSRFLKRSLDSKNGDLPKKKSTNLIKSHVSSSMNRQSSDFKHVAYSKLGPCQQICQTLQRYEPGQELEFYTKLIAECRKFLQESLLMKDRKRITGIYLKALEKLFRLQNQSNMKFNSQPDSLFQVHENMDKRAKQGLEAKGDLHTKRRIPHSIDVRESFDFKDTSTPEKHLAPDSHDHIKEPGVDFEHLTSDEKSKLARELKHDIRNTRSKIKLLKKKLIDPKFSDSKEDLKSDIVHLRKELRTLKYQYNLLENRRKAKTGSTYEDLSSEMSSLLSDENSEIVPAFPNGRKYTNVADKGKIKGCPTKSRNLDQTDDLSESSTLSSSTQTLVKSLNKDLKQDRPRDTNMLIQSPGKDLSPGKSQHGVASPSRSFLAHAIKRDLTRNDSETTIESVSMDEEDQISVIDNIDGRQRNRTRYQPQCLNKQTQTTLLKSPQLKNQRVQTEDYDLSIPGKTRRPWDRTTKDLQGLDKPAPSQLNNHDQNTTSDRSDNTLNSNLIDSQSKLMSSKYSQTESLQKNNRYKQNREINNHFKVNDEKQENDQSYPNQRHQHQPDEEYEIQSFKEPPSNMKVLFTSKQFDNLAANNRTLSKIPNLSEDDCRQNIGFKPIKSHSEENFMDDLASKKDDCNDAVFPEPTVNKTGFQPIKRPGVNPQMSERGFDQEISSYSKSVSANQKKDADFFRQNFDDEEFVTVDGNLNSSMTLKEANLALQKEHSHSNQNGEDSIKIGIENKAKSDSLFQDDDNEETGNDSVLRRHEDSTVEHGEYAYGDDSNQSNKRIIKAGRDQEGDKKSENDNDALLMDDLEQGFEVVDDLVYSHINDEIDKKQMSSNKRRTFNRQKTVVRESVIKRMESIGESKQKVETINDSESHFDERLDDENSMISHAANTEDSLKTPVTGDDQTQPGNSLKMQNTGTR